MEVVRKEEDEGGEGDDGGQKVENSIDEIHGSEAERESEGWCMSEEEEEAKMCMDTN